jgi:pimeloyl-ACP methyl ester carboxylesterase
VPALTTSDGRRLAWREAGAGPPLVLHPGGPGCSGTYFDELPELGAERTLIALDPRGTGESDRPADPSAYDLEDYARDVEAVREHLGVERLDLIGHSHGGFVAMTWAGTHPERVGRLVLASTTARFTDSIRRARMERAASHQGRPYFEDAMDAVRAHSAGGYADDAELAALYERELPLFLPVGSDTSTYGAVLRRAGVNADALRHFNERIAGGMDLRPMLARIDAPTLVITGDQDPFGPPIPQEIAAELPSSQLHIIPGADHFPHLEPDHRAQWSQTILDFLASEEVRPL